MAVWGLLIVADDDEIIVEYCVISDYWSPGSRIIARSK